MRKHINTHSKLNQFPCEICSRPFHASPNLSVHLKKSHHARLRQNGFLCINCDKLFDSADSFKDHVNECAALKKTLEAGNHNDTNLKEEYSCDFCSRKYTVYTSFFQHMQRKHYANKRKSGYKCICCEREFQNLEEIKEHLGK